MSDHLYLVHHGIKGQRWGVRNGPPYPLGYSDKSAAERRASKALTSNPTSGQETSSTKEKHWTDERKAKAKKVAKGVAITAGVVLAIYGGYKLSQMPAVQERLGRLEVSEILTKGAPFQFSDMTGSSRPRVGKSIGDIDTAMVRSMNSNNPGKEGDFNCTHNAMGYILNSIFGKSVTAKGFYGVDEVSGLRMPHGRNGAIFDVAFNDITHIAPPEGEAFNRSLRRIPPGSTGILFIKPDFEGIRTRLMRNGLTRQEAERHIRALDIGSHALNYEKTASGALTFVDCQKNAEQIFGPGSEAARRLGVLYSIGDIMDFSNASISDTAEEVFRYCIDESRNAG